MTRPFLPPRLHNPPATVLESSPQWPAVFPGTSNNRQALARHSLSCISVVTSMLERDLTARLATQENHNVGFCVNLRGLRC
jgi:hypothetical protein